VAAAQRRQSGHLDGYLLHTLMALSARIAVVTAQD
jgi:hypothetical protein